MAAAGPAGPSTDTLPGTSGDASLDADTAQGVVRLLEEPQTGLPSQQRVVMNRSQLVFSGDALLAWLIQIAATSTTSEPSTASTANPPKATKPSTASQASSSSAVKARQWLVSTCGDRQGAEDAAAQLLSANVISLATAQLPTLEQCARVDPASEYLLSHTAAPPLAGQPLNTAYWWNRPARPANQVASELRRLVLRLYGKHLSDDGRALQYTALREDSLWKEYVTATAELQRVDLAPLSQPELTALFINLYNTLIIHAIVVLGQPDNPAKRAVFYTRDAAYCIAGHTYTADDIEHGVLRGNSPTASNIWALIGLRALARGPFKHSDPRVNKICKPMDPRIHFALVCGAKSCPPIRVYSADNLDQGLTAAGESFCSSEVEVDTHTRTVTLSKIFQWYSVDFGANDREKLHFILRFLTGTQKSDLETLLSTSDQIRVVYKPYDWSLNS